MITWVLLLYIILLFLAYAWLLWLMFWIQYWTEGMRVGIVLFLILEENLSAFLHLVCRQEVTHKWVLSDWAKVLRSSMVFHRFFFSPLYLWRWSCDFCPCFYDVLICVWWVILASLGWYVIFWGLVALFANILLRILVSMFITETEL